MLEPQTPEPPGMPVLPAMFSTLCKWAALIIGVGCLIGLILSPISNRGIPPAFYLAGLYKSATLLFFALVIDGIYDRR